MTFPGTIYHPTKLVFVILCKWNSGSTDQTHWHWYLSRQWVCLHQYDTYIWHYFLISATLIHPVKDLLVHTCAVDTPCTLQLPIKLLLSLCTLTPRWPLSIAQRPSHHVSDVEQCSVEVGGGSRRPANPPYVWLMPSLTLSLHPCLSLTSITLHMHLPPKFCLTIVHEFYPNSN